MDMLIRDSTESPVQSPNPHVSSTSLYPGQGMDEVEAVLAEDNAASGAAVTPAEEGEPSGVSSAAEATGAVEEIEGGEGHGEN